MTFGRAIKEAVTQWKAKDPAQRAQAQLAGVDSPHRTEIAEAKQRILFLDDVSSIISTIDLETVADEMKKTHSTLLHARIGLGPRKETALGLDATHSLDKPHRLHQHRKYGMAEYCQFLETSENFRNLRSMALDSGLYVGFQSLPLERTHTAKHSFNNTQIVLTFSSEPVRRPQYNPRGGIYLSESKRVAYYERNIGPVTDIQKLVPTQPLRAKFRNPLSAEAKAPSGAS